jgi:hypothetical protein
MPDLETPEEDAAEQEQEVVTTERPVAVGSSPEVDDGDLAESSVEVPLDEDDYR